MTPVLASVNRRLAATEVVAEFDRVEQLLPSRFDVNQLVELRFKAFTMVAIVLAAKFTDSKVLYDLGLYTGYTDVDSAGVIGLNNSLFYDENGQELIRVLAVDSWFVHPHEATTELLPVLDNIDTTTLNDAQDFQRDTPPVPEEPVAADAIGDASDEAQDNLTAMQPQSLEHSALDGRATVVRQITIEGTEEATKTVLNLLAAIQRNTEVGHSAVIGAFFDGDGADKLRFVGLPANTGAEQAAACSDYGDGVLALIGSEVAQVINERMVEHEGETLTVLDRKTVWPKEMVETPTENPAPEENNVEQKQEAEPTAPVIPETPAST